MVIVSTSSPLRRPGVRLAVGHIGAEPALADGDLALGDRIVAELLEQGGGGPASPLLGLGEDLQRLVEGDGEQLVLAVERPRSVPFLM